MYHPLLICHVWLNKSIVRQESCHGFSRVVPMPRKDLEEPHPKERHIDATMAQRWCQEGA